MARHGENIRKRKDGRWEGRCSVYSAEKGKRVYYSVYGKNYEEVQQKMAAKKNFIRDQIEKDGTEIAFAEAAQGWLAQIKEKRKPSTYIKYSLVYQKYVEERFEDAALDQMTDSFVRERLSDASSDSVRKSVYSVLKQILKYASVHYSLMITPLGNPDSEYHNKPVKVLSRGEQRLLIPVLYCKMNLFKMAVLLVLLTGLRLGELCALKWTDIDFENKILAVNRTVQRLYAEGYRTKTILMETAPKSEHSIREIPLSAMLSELLAKFQNGKEYIFGGNKPMEPRTMQYHFKGILKEAGLPDMNFHILRHTFSTNCIEDGMDVKSLSEMLGHSDVQITLNRYVHPSMDTKRKYMDSLSEFYGQIYGQVG